jgi:hypothetical protein
MSGRLSDKDGNLISLLALAKRFPLDAQIVSIHTKGRVCLLNGWEWDEWSRGVKPDCKQHRHVSRPNAFYISRESRFGELLELVQRDTKKTSRADGCYVKVAGTVEYVHLKKRIKPNLENIYALGERIASEHNLKFVRRKEFEYLMHL